jgi:hypothetical protein
LVEAFVHFCQLHGDALQNEQVIEGDLNLSHVKIELALFEKVEVGITHLLFLEMLHELFSLRLIEYLGQSFMLLLLQILELPGHEFDDVVLVIE